MLRADVCADVEHVVAGVDAALEQRNAVHLPVHAAREYLFDHVVRRVDVELCISADDRRDLVLTRPGMPRRTSRGRPRRARRVACCRSRAAVGGASSRRPAQASTEARQTYP